MTTSRNENALLREALALAAAVQDHGHFGEMVGALRHAEQALKQGELALPDDVTPEVALERLRRGRLILALAHELWIEKRV